MNQKPNNKFQICQLFVSRINADIKAAVDNAGGKTPRLQEAGFLCQRGLFRGPGKMFFQDVAGNRALIMVLPHGSLHPVDNLRRDALAEKIGPYFVPSPAAVLDSGSRPTAGPSHRHSGSPAGQGFPAHKQSLRTQNPSAGGAPSALHGCMRGGQGSGRRWQELSGDQLHFPSFCLLFCGGSSGFFGSSTFLTMPDFSIIFSSSSRLISGCSLRNDLVFSRPWPMRSPL